MKIVFFTESLPPHTDGVSRTITNLIATLNRFGIEYKCFSPFKSENGLWGDRVEKVISIPFPLYPRYRIALPFFHDLENEFSGFEPDIVHVCSPTFLGLAGIRMAKKANIPVVCSFHTRFISYARYYKLSPIEKHGWRYLRWFYNQADLSVVPSKDTKGELGSLGFENLDIWSRGIDTAKFSPKFADESLKQQWSPDGNPIVLFVGRLVREKDVDILIDAIRILKNKDIKHQMVFVGGGPLQKDVSEKLPNAILTGHLEDEELSRAYASADIFAFPSTTETFGNVILEAAASGLPAVGARAGGIKNVIINKETGFLSKPRDSEDFAKKLEKLLIDDKLRKLMSEKALANSAKYNIYEVNLGLVEKYKGLIDKYRYEYQNPDLFSESSIK